MSGAFGWITNNDSRDNMSSKKFTGAQDAYLQTPAAGVKRLNPKTAAARKLSSVTSSGNIPDAGHAVKSTAANVLIVIQDVTVSMHEWPQEIFKRLPLMYADAVKYLGSDDLEILFIAHGDARTDMHPVQVARFGKGAELDVILASFYTHCGGGGQGTESQELVAYYLLNFCDTSSARNVYAFFITDEAGCDEVSASLAEEYLPAGNLTEDVCTASVFQLLARKMNIYAVLCETNSYDPAPIAHWWAQTLAGEHVIPLNDHRRIVDTMLGTIAKTTGQLDVFTKDLRSRQGGTRFGDANIQTVFSSIALVGHGTPSSPYHVPSGNGTRPLLPPPDSKKK